MNKTLLTLFLIGVALPAMAAADAWVTADRLNRRTCPDVKCGIVGVLMFREPVTIFEKQGSWARISKYYDASCRNGASAYIESGNAACVERNGIVHGRFAEWISMDYISTTRPPDPGTGATGDHALVRGSDDYRIYKDAFAKSAAELIDAGACTEQDFREIGGWIKSTSQSGPIYFTYCGGTRTDNRLYLNAATGDIYR